MSYWQSIALGLQLAAQVGAVAERYSQIPKKVAIKMIIAKLQETLNEMVLD